VKQIQSSVWQVRDHFYERKKKIVTTGKKKFQSSVWQVCQFLVLAGNWQFFCCGGKVLLLPEKKIQLSVWRVRDHYYDLKKKVPVVCLAGVSVFGSGGKLAVFLLWGESFITTGKKEDTVVCLVGA
jgi:hypothetical protein